MEFAEVVRRRKMIRNYRDDPVAPEALERIVHAARRAPSAGHTQGQYLVVVTEAKTRRAIAELGNEPHYVAQGMPPWMSTAPIHVVVCVREDDYHERYQEADKLTEDGTEMEWSVPYWWVDAGATMMLLLLAAVDEGLSAGFFGSHRLEGLRRLLAIPTDVSPVGIITIGHAASTATTGSAKRGRRPAEQIVHRERWNPGSG
ncbi:MAG: nitroreductase family protein [Actinomycetota bacterium]